MAQRAGRCITLLFHDRGTRRGLVVSSTPRPLFTPGKEQVLIVQEAGWAPGSVWMGGKSRPKRDSIPDRPGLSSVAIPTELTAHFPIYYSPYFYNYIDWFFRNSAVRIAILYEMDGLGFYSFGREIFRTCTDGPRGPPSLLYKGNGALSGG